MARPGTRRVCEPTGCPGFNIVDFDADVVKNLRRISPRIEIFRTTDARNGERTTVDAGFFAPSLSEP
jgi:hypothetical protein